MSLLKMTEEQRRAVSNALYEMEREASKAPSKRSTRELSGGRYLRITIHQTTYFSSHTAQRRLWYVNGVRESYSHAWWLMAKHMGFQK